MSLRKIAAEYHMSRAKILSGKPSTRTLIRALRAANLTYVGAKKLRRLAFGMELVRSRNVPGVIVEAGVALGGSAILLAKLRDQGRPLHLYDTFGMIPAPGAMDEQDAHERYEEIRSGRSAGIRNDQYYGYRRDLIAQVEDNLAKFGVCATDGLSFFPGTFEESLYPADMVALAHIDCDWHDSVTTCIERIFPKLSRHGVMIFDDYESYAGCKKAVDAFIANANNIKVLFVERSVGIQKL